MSVEQKLRNLYSLQTKLSEIDHIRTLRGELPLEVQDLEDEIEGLATRIEKLNKDIVSLQKQIAERKGNIEVNNTNIARFKEQTETVRNNREYDNLSKQIEYAELDNQLNEKKINEAKAEVEAKTHEVAQCNLLVQERRTDLDIKKSELDEIITETKAEEEKLREDAKNLVASRSAQAAVIKAIKAGETVVDLNNPTDGGDNPDGGNNGGGNGSGTSGTGGNTSRQYTLSVTSANTAQGTVSGGGTYSEGSRVNITATPKSGYQFDKWSDGNTQSTRTINVTKNESFVAQFIASAGSETGEQGGNTENPGGEENPPEFT